MLAPSSAQRSNAAPSNRAADPTSATPMAERADLSERLHRLADHADDVPEHLLVHVETVLDRLERLMADDQQNWAY